MTLPQALQIAVQHHQAGRLVDAEALYRQILAAQSNHAEALHLLGVIACQTGRHELAIESLRKAIAANPAGLHCRLHLGNALTAQGHLDEAIAAYRGALQLNPGYAEAHNNLGVALRDRGRSEEAIAAYRRALELQPDSPETHTNLGNALSDLGRFDEAIAAHRRAVEIKPDFPNAHNNLGNALRDRGQLSEAIASYRRAIQFNPSYPEANSNLGNALRELGQLDEAIASCRRALQIKPDFSEAHNNLGNALRDRGHLDEAIAAHRRAIEIKPGYPDAHNNLGNALRDRGRLDDAIAAYRRALELQPGYPEAQNNLGNALRDCGQLEEAIAAFRHALQLKPDDSRIHGNLIHTLYFLPDDDRGRIAGELQRWNRNFGEPARRFARAHSNDPNPDRTLRIGYMSPDFRSHVVGRYILPLFQRHDRTQFEILCYSGVARPDEMTERFRALRGFAGWRNTVGVSDARLAEMIREDAVDILVDLTQHMAGNRLPVFARKPAPVQVSFAGYPESTGLEAIEYRISDRHLEGGPFGSAGEQVGSAVAGLSEAGGRSSGGHSRRRGIDAVAGLPGFAGEGVGEAVAGLFEAGSVGSAGEQPRRIEHVFLIDSFWCYDPCGMEVEVNPPPRLASGVLTFGCLNSFCKINERVLSLWARVLGRVEESRLVISSPAGGHRSRTWEAFEREGVASRRVEFVDIQPWREYLELYHRLDIALDSFPYNGGVTSCDALWMGVPVVSLAGAAPVSRAGLSLLTNLGLPELVAHSETEYVNIAEGLARDLPRLAALRSTLRERMKNSVLMDAARFTRQVEQAYREMWQAWSGERTLEPGQ